MGLSIKVTTKGSAAERVRQIDADARPSVELHRFMADELRQTISQGFLALAGSNRGSLGHSGFWNRMLSGTVTIATEQEGIVSMPREVAQRFFGGTLTPQGGKKWITIPARSESYNKSALQFSDLEFIKTGAASAMLVQRRQTTFNNFRSGKRKGQANPKSAKELPGGLVFYWLVKSVTQQGNPAVLPTDAEIFDAAERGIANFFRYRQSPTA